MHFLFSRTRYFHDYSADILLLQPSQETWSDLPDHKEGGTGLSSELNNNIYFKKHFQDILIMSFGYMFVVLGFGLGIYYIMKHIPNGTGDCEHTVFY